MLITGFECLNKISHVTSRFCTSLGTAWMSCIDLYAQLLRRFHVWCGPSAQVAEGCASSLPRPLASCNINLDGVCAGAGAPDQLRQGHGGVQRDPG
eukprot:scaffold146092_cov19-Prasinocladus_malaysianus.AAC.2